MTTDQLSDQLMRTALTTTGSRTNVKNPLFLGVLGEGGAKSDAFLAISVVAELLSDPDVQFLLASWAELPESIRAGIVYIVKGSVDE